MPPARLGLVYSHTGLRKFIDAIGAARTRELFFTRPQRRRAHGARAGAWSTRSPSPGGCAEQAVELAAEIAANAPLSPRRATSA